jgi:hypothetical protein
MTKSIQSKIKINNKILILKIKVDFKYIFRASNTSFKLN